MNDRMSLPSRERGLKQMNDSHAPGLARVWMSLPSRERGLKLGLTLIMLGLFMPSTPAQAHGCCPIPSIQRVEAAVHAVTAAITSSGRAITQQLAVGTASQNNAIRDQTRTIEEIMKAHAATLGAMESQRLYGTAGEMTLNGKQVRLTAQSPSLCKQLRAARALAESAQKRVNADALITENNRSHNEDSRSERSLGERLRDAPRQDFALTWFSQRLLTEAEVQNGIRSIKNMTNPSPLPRLTEQDKDTNIGKAYLAERALTNQKHALVQRVLNRQLLLRAPLIDEAGKKTSVLAKIEERVLETVEDSGESPWIEVLEQKGVAPLLRELNITAAHIYRAEYENLQTNQDIASLLAVLVSADARRDGQAVSQKYSDLIGEEDG